MTQTRPPDPGTELGAGAVAELSERVAETGADTVVVDNDLTPGQTVFPLTDDAMSLVSWLHDEAVEADVEYGNDAATVEFAAKPATVERARARARELSEPTV